MSTDLWLDPDLTDGLSPFDWDVAKRRGAGISPFAVPLSVDIQKSNGGVRVSRLVFVYPNEEDDHVPSPLDSGERPQVTLKISTLSHRISEIVVAPAVDRSGLILVAERLQKAAETAQPRAKSFSYRMTANVLREFADKIIAAEHHE